MPTSHATRTWTRSGCGTDASIPGLKWVTRTYSTDLSQHASALDPEKCGGPDCYVRSVIIPAAELQSEGAARNVQVRQASVVLPSGAPSGFQSATLDLLTFAWTSALIDQDFDGTEDRVDPCPNDPADSCRMDLLGSGDCPAGQVFCTDSNGDLGCLDAFLCNQRGDLNNNCQSDGLDANLLFGVQNGIQGAENFNTTVPIGPFDP